LALYFQTKQKNTQNKNQQQTKKNNPTASREALFCSHVARLSTSSFQEVHMP
jgi:hypothetical protein